uniref:Phospholipase A2 n=1 Tax=Pagrus major TaxID=143350 RepID=Q0KKQ2_PAGMA|nr:phospholipase A2 [Pagrus major]
MNVSGPLLMLLLTACTVSVEKSARSGRQFRYMINCVQPDVTALMYNNYGCHCGLGGKGTPVDDLDRCCKVHDDCYKASMKSPECSGFFRFLLEPKSIHYWYTCSARRVTCSATNNKCKAAACECDRAAAHCFAQAKYNPEHKHVDQKLCEK